MATVNFEVEETTEAMSKDKEAGTQRKKKRKPKRFFKAFMKECKYELVRQVLFELGAEEEEEDGPWLLAWLDWSVSISRVTRMKPYQRINHFPGMSEICRKDLLAKNLNMMKRLLPEDYNFFPHTWCLPKEYNSLQRYSKTRKKGIYIVKPHSSCQGNGIFLTKNVSAVKNCADAVCQRYIVRPLLIDGYKFDLRLYVLLTSCDPLRVYLYKEGLARFATLHYKMPRKQNMEEPCMHLTNYAINRKSDQFSDDEEAGSKRYVSVVEKLLCCHGYDVEMMWRRIDDVIIKTILSVLPYLQRIYHTCFPLTPAISPCFEILGFDIILSHRLKPYLLEVNHSPSLHAPLSLDYQLKTNLIRDALLLVNLNQKYVEKLKNEEQKKTKSRLTGTLEHSHRKFTAGEILLNENQERHERKTLGNFRQIYPASDMASYEMILQAMLPPDRNEN